MTVSRTLIPIRDLKACLENPRIFVLQCTRVLPSTSFVANISRLISSRSFRDKSIILKMK